MSELSDTLLRWIDQYLQHILEAPPMWGSPEAVEMQVLQLIEVRALVLHTGGASQTPGSVFDAYLSYLSRQFPRQPQRPLFELVGQDDEVYSKLAAGLRGFVLVMTQGDPGKPRKPRRPVALVPVEPFVSQASH